MTFHRTHLLTLGGSWNCPYCSNAAVKGVKPVMEITNVTTDTHGYVAVDDLNSVVYIVYRGTVDLQNWITNLNAFSTANLTLPYCQGQGDKAQVHDGFYEAYRSVQAQIATAYEILRNRGSGGYQVIVTGHSLGAALATLSAVHLTCDEPFNNLPIAVYNYGSPRIGGDQFSTLVSQTLSDKMPLFRHTHWRDPVPHLPLMDMGYRHAAREYFLQQDWSPPQGNHSVTVCNGSGEDPNCSDQFLIDYDIDDHLHYFDYSLETPACTAVPAL